MKRKRKDLKREAKYWFERFCEVDRAGIEARARLAETERQVDGLNATIRRQDRETEELIRQRDGYKDELTKLRRSRGQERAGRVEQLDDEALAILVDAANERLQAARRKADVPEDGIYVGPELAAYDAVASVERARRKAAGVDVETVSNAHRGAVLPEAVDAGVSLHGCTRIDESGARSTAARGSMSSRQPSAPTEEDQQ